MASSTGWMHCPVCDDHVSGQHLWNIHLRSRRHVRICEEQGVPPDVAPEETETIPNHRFCATCFRQIPNKSFAQHIAGKKHLAKERFALYTAVLEEAESDKHGVTVNGNFDFGIVEVAQATPGVRKNATISTQVPNASIRLLSTTLASSKGIAVAYSPYVLKLPGNMTASES